MEQMEQDLPRLVVVAGPNGGGKTSITEQLLAHSWMGGCVYVNPDVIARDEFGDWNAEGPVLAAARRAQEIREECLRVQRAYVYDNSVDAAPPRLLFRTSEGKVVRRYGEVNAWAAGILEECERDNRSRPR